MASGIALVTAMVFTMVTVKPAGQRCAISPAVNDPKWVNPQPPGTECWWDGEKVIFLPTTQEP